MEAHFGDKSIDDGPVPPLDDPYVGKITAQTHYMSLQAKQTQSSSHSPCTHCTTISEEVKLPKFVFTHLLCNGENQKVFKISEASCKAIVSAVSSLGKLETSDEKTELALEGHQYVLELFNQERVPMEDIEKQLAQNDELKLLNPNLKSMLTNLSLPIRIKPKHLKFHQDMFVGCCLPLLVVMP